MTMKQTHSGAWHAVLKEDCPEVSTCLALAHIYDTENLETLKHIHTMEEEEEIEELIEALEECFPTHSGHIGKIAKALAAAQAEMVPAKKDADNPYFKSKYADLAEVIHAAKPLAKHGIAHSSMVLGDTLVTMLIHTSDQWLKSTYPLRPTKSDPQGFASAITYARRYSLQSMAAIPAQDDDGNEASVPAPSAKNSLDKLKESVQAKLDKVPGAEAWALKLAKVETLGGIGRAALTKLNKYTLEQLKEKVESNE